MPKAIEIENLFTHLKKMNMLITYEPELLIFLKFKEFLKKCSLNYINVYDKTTFCPDNTIHTQKFLGNSDEQVKIIFFCFLPSPVFLLYYILDFTIITMTCLYLSIHSFIHKYTVEAVFY